MCDIPSAFCCRSLVLSFFSHLHGTSAQLCTLFKKLALLTSFHTQGITETLTQTSLLPRTRTLLWPSDCSWTFSKGQLYSLSSSTDLSGNVEISRGELLSWLLFRSTFPCPWWPLWILSRSGPSRQDWSLSEPPRIQPWSSCPGACEDDRNFWRFAEKGLISDV